MLGLTQQCDNPPTVELNVFDAKVNGADFRAASAGWSVDSTRTPARFILSSLDSLGNEILIKVDDLSLGAHTFQLTGGTAEATYISRQGVFFFGESGAIDIQELTSERAKGVFFFDAIDINNSDDPPLVISQGGFSLGVAE